MLTVLLAAFRGGTGRRFPTASGPFVLVDRDICHPKATLNRSSADCRRHRATFSLCSSRGQVVPSLLSSVSWDGTYRNGILGQPGTVIAGPLIRGFMH